MHLKWVSALVTMGAKFDSACAGYNTLRDPFLTDDTKHLQGSQEKRQDAGCRCRVEADRLVIALLSNFGLFFTLFFMCCRDGESRLLIVRSNWLAKTDSAAAIFLGV